MTATKTIDKALQYFFQDKTEAVNTMTEKQLERVKRLEDTFVVMRSNPHYTEKMIVTWLMETYNIQKSQAYRDITDTRSLLGRVDDAAKEFERFSASQMVREGYDLIKNAKDRLDVQRGEGKIKAGLALVKIFRLDKVDPDKLPLDKFIPPNLEPAYDPALAGNTMSMSEIQQKIKKIKIEEGIIEDVDHEDIS